MSVNDNKSNVIVLDMVTRLDIPVSRVIDAAIESDLDKVVILGYTKAGDEFFSSSMASGADVVWLMERLKMQLLQVGDEIPNNQ